MTEVELDEWWPWIVAFCTVCGPFISSVHESDLDLLLKECEEHDEAHQADDAPYL